jgi:GntR family transcriptional regulator / MocR family aminotransferase
MKIATVLPLVGIDIDPSARVPLHRQLYESLRTSILEGRLEPGVRLPATRAMARHLGFSRNTIVAAYEQLLVEGCLEARVGAGTCVTRSLGRNTLLPLSRVRKPFRERAVQPSSLSRRGRMLANEGVPTLQSPDSPRAFEAGLPDATLFPFQLWARLAARRWRRPSYAITTYSDPAGYAPLREAVAHYLKLWRGVQCGKEQIVIVSGSQCAIDLAARLLTDPGDLALIENPGYRGARSALLAAGVKLVPLPVDKQGADIVKCDSSPPHTRLVYVTPSHQYPLGVTMTLERRTALLNWATRKRAWILEDDYDSEYCYRAKPLPSLQGLDPWGRVLYIGTFSKTLFPSLRLGFLVAPAALVDDFRRAQSAVCCHAPVPQQVVLAEFIAEGHFARHLARMRNLYGERRSLLVDCLKGELGNLFEIGGADAGLHLAALLPKGTNDKAVATAATRHGIYTTPLSFCDLTRKARPGLLLGFAALTDIQIRNGVTALAKSLVGGRSLRPSNGSSSQCGGDESQGGEPGTQHHR